MTSRREVIAGALGACATAVPLATRAQPAKRTFLLVHGSWAGGWIWRHVVDLLENQGHKVFAPTLTGLGERSHLLDARVNLDTHIADIVNTIKWERLENLVLAGHSYAGDVITGVAQEAEGAISSIVFVDAFLPLGGSLPQMQIPAVRDAIQAAQQRSEIVLPPPAAAFFQGNVRDRPWLDSLFTPQPIATYTSNLTITGARERISKKAFIRAIRYREPVLDAGYKQVKSDPAWRTYELDCGHHVMVDMPDRLTEILLQAV